MASKRNPVIHSSAARAMEHGAATAAHAYVVDRIGDAEIVLDLLQTAGPAPAVLAQVHVGQDGAESLLRVAVASWRKRFPRNRLKRDWCAHIGIYRHADRKESHYDCLFCRSSLATLGRGTVRKLAPAFVDKLQAHTDRCALIWIVSGTDPDRFAELARTERGMRNPSFSSADYNEHLHSDGKYSSVREPG